MEIVYTQIDERRPFLAFRDVVVTPASDLGAGVFVERERDVQVLETRGSSRWKGLGGGGGVVHKVMLGRIQCHVATSGERDGVASESGARVGNGASPPWVIRARRLWTQL